MSDHREQDHLTSATFVPASDESQVRRGGQILSRGVTALLHVARVKIPVGGRVMQGCRIGAVSVESRDKSDNYSASACVMVTPLRLALY